MSQWPIGWAWQSLRLPDWFYATHTGMDSVTYVRFLRGCMWWILLQTFTTAPILLAIHFRFSEGAPLGDMNRASLAYLVTIYTEICAENATSSDCVREPNAQGRSLLWIHCTLIWWVTITWYLTLFWIGRGSLRVRRRLLESIRTDRKAALAELQRERSKEQEAAVGDERVGQPMRTAQGLLVNADSSQGWRQRTLLVTNLPTTMRNEASVRRYFEEYLRPDDASSTTNHSQTGSIVEHGTDSTSLSREGGQQSPGGPGPDLMPSRHSRSPVQTVVQVRKMHELSVMLARRQEVLQQLEAAHVKLAQNVLGKADSTHRKRRNKQTSTSDQTAKGGVLSKLVFWKKPKQQTTEAADKSAARDELADLLARFTTSSEQSREKRIDSDDGEKVDDDQLNDTVWEALADVPRHLLDPYQPVTRLSALFRGQKVPTIDYLLTKLNLLTALITEMKSRPPTDYEPASTAFVTFRDPRQARMVWRELKTQIVVKARMAPEVKDLDWERLMRTSFTGNLVRGIGVNAFFWGFTVFWIIPLQIVTTGLFSVKNLSSVSDSVANFFVNHQQLESFVSNTLPSLLVSLATMSVPELVFQISKRAQGFVTFSDLYDQCLIRYWKFIICNVVIFFTIGVTAVETILITIARTSSDSRILDNLAYSFPTAAPFFVSYFILGMALHTGFELLGFMVPIIQHFLGVNKATTPRARAIKSMPRNFNRYYWLPFHTLIMTIVFIFMILNPLVLPFAMVYIFVALIVFKKNLAFTYYRRFEERNGVIYFVRLFRFSLDGLTTAQVVLLIFFSITRQSRAYIALTAVLIPITVGFKVIGTRLWKSQCRAVDDEEGRILCDIDLWKTAEDESAAIGSLDKNYGEDGQRGDSMGSRAPLTSSNRAWGRYPEILAPPPTQSRFLQGWQIIHDSFHANGADKPSYLAQRQAEGNPVTNAPGTSIALVAKAPFRAVSKARKDGQQIKQTAALALGVDKAMKAEANRQKDHTDADLAIQDKTLELRASIGQHELQREASMVKRAPSTAKARADRRRLPSAVSMKSIRSLPGQEAPFLSDFEAISAHAPVDTENGIVLEDEFEDGEETMTISRRRNRSMRRAAAVVDPYGSTNFDELAAPYGKRTGPSLRRILSQRRTQDNERQEDVLADQKAMPSSHIGWTTPEEAQHAQTAKNEDDDEYYDDDYDYDDGPLVRPHAKVRWDDTPNNNARYNNPFYACELDDFLWLPLDPMQALNLNNTIEWHGAALVSSDGGSGVVGEWTEEDEEDGESDYDGATTISRLGYLDGREEISLNPTLARALDRAEEQHLDTVVDPAASVPKRVLSQYKKAIRRQSSASHDEGVAGNYSGGDSIGRHTSNISENSMHSPPASIRQHVDAQFRDEQAVTGAVVAAAPLTSSPLPTSSRPDEFGVFPSSSSPTKVDSSAPPSALDVTPRKTHFAPDADGKLHQRGSGMPLSASAGSFGPLRLQTSPRHDRYSSAGASSLGEGGAATSPVRPRHARREPSANNTISGAASIISGGADTQVGRAISMRRALQAEVLEEERRRSLRDRLARSQSKKNRSLHRSSSRAGTVSSQRGGHTKDDEEAGIVSAQTEQQQKELKEEEDYQRKQESKIMERHERAVQEREQQRLDTMAEEDDDDNDTPSGLSGLLRLPSTGRRTLGRQSSRTSSIIQRSPRRPADETHEMATLGGGGTNAASPSPTAVATSDTAPPQLPTPPALSVEAESSRRI